MQRELFQQYNHRFMGQAQLINKALDELYKSVIMLVDNSTLRQFFLSSDKIRNSDYYLIPEITQTLFHFSTSYDLISQIFIVFKHSNLVISAMGSSQMDTFFSSTNIISHYPFSFWEETSRLPENIIILKPTIVKSKYTTAELAVTPIVTSTIGQYYSNNYLVILLDNRVLQELLSNSILVNDAFSSLQFTNNETISIGRESSENVNFSTILSGMAFHGVVYKQGLPKKSISPYKHIFILLELVNILAFALSLLAAFRLTAKIYAPVRKLAEFLKEKNQVSLSGNELNSFTVPTNSNEYEFIEKQVKLLSDQYQDLEHDFQLILPTVLERYLIKILNSPEIKPKAETIKLLEKYGMALQFKYFVGIVILHPQDDNLLDGILSFINNQNSELVNTLFLQPDNTTILLIINSDQDENCQKCVEDTREFLQILIRGSNYSSLKAGSGQIHQGLDGLRRSYREAMITLLHIENSAEEYSFSIYHSGETHMRFIYTIEEEQKLHNNILNGNKKQALSVFQEIIDKNLNAGIEESTGKELFGQLFYTALRVAYSQNLSPEQITKGEYIPFTLFKNMPLLDLQEYVHKFIALCSEWGNDLSGKTDLVQVKKYIEENFQSPIYMDSIAGQFKISPKYLSRMYKKRFGISINENLIKLRIDHAADLLKHTKLPIQDISLQSGFTSRNTFIRLFREYYGTTPSSIRKQAFH